MTDLQNNPENKEQSKTSDSNSSEEIIVLEKIHKSHKSGKFYVTSKGRIVDKSKKSSQSSRKHHHHHHSGNSKKHSKKKKMSRKKKILIGILIFLIMIPIIAFIAFTILKSLGKNALLEQNNYASINTIDGAESYDNGQTIIYKGETYHFNKNLATIVVMGVDKSELGTDMYGAGGQADAIYIFAYDTNTDKCFIIPVSRETMTDVRVYSTSGTDIGLQKLQLCLAYSYGDGKESSCKNTLESLSRIFYNIPFNTYVSLNWDSIGPLNDAIGGVTVTALEDVPTTTSNTIPKGTKVTLNGQDAWSYVKYRNIDKLESNPDRLARQKQYINAYMSKLIPMAKSDLTLISDIYGIANDYMCTNVSLSKTVYIAANMLPTLYSAKDIEFVSIKGKTKRGDIFAEFYPDETNLYESILKVFYMKEE